MKIEIVEKDYHEFLKSKTKNVNSVGFDIDISELNPMLFDWQKQIVKWALKRGRAALFEDCGLGKTPQQLEWAHQVSVKTGRRVIIFTPLAVAKQTEREAHKFNIDAAVCRDGKLPDNQIIITNYERMHYFNPEEFAGIVLDESSILKSFDGSTRKALTEFAGKIFYRLACTATPAPNDLIELTNHAEFLDVMTGKEIIALFFKQDGNTTHAWRLKGHAEEAFWKWMAEWSVAIRKPSDLGHEDGKFTLPALHIEQVEVEGDILPGELFQVEAQSLLERRQARRASINERVKAAAEIANNTDEQVLVWCDLNSESADLTKSIRDAVEIKGADSPEHKEKAMIGFTTGDIRVLVTKPSIAGWGMNWQQCNKMVFVGLSDSYEAFYQAVRRCWRFGQEREVTAHVITATTEGAVVRNIRRKEDQAMTMFDNIVKHMKIYEEIAQGKKDVMDYKTNNERGENWTLILGDSCEMIKSINDNSIGLSIFSPPFPGMYAYTNSERDIGNVKNFTELLDHFQFLMPEILRITMPGRSCCIHLTQEPVFKGRDGYVGLRDFRGETIRRMQNDGWIYYGEVTIDKNPQLKASRTKEHSLLFKTLSKDSSSVRMAMADYLLQFRKPGENTKPIDAGTHPRWNPKGGWINEDEWCEWAAPVWYRKIGGKDESRFKSYPSLHQATDGISETDVLKVWEAKDEKDEKHLCPLQLGVIERAIKLWSAPGDTVFSPFAGIGSEGYQAIKLYRKFIGIELKESYWNVAVENLKHAEAQLKEKELPLLQNAL